MNSRPNGKSRPILIAVIPVYNESANLEALIAEWVACLKAEVGEFLMILLNDGSLDNTWQVLLRLAEIHGECLHLVNKANSGHGRTCRMGYDIALGMGAPWVFQIDSDGQCDPKHFHEFWSGCESFDCIFGVRTVRDDGLGRVFVSFCCRILVWLVTGAYIRDPNVPYRLIRSAALREALQMVPHDFDIQNVALSLALHRLRGLRWKHILIHFRGRRGGENSINYRQIVTMGLKMLREIRSIR